MKSILISTAVIPLPPFKFKIKTISLCLRILCEN
uniref:Uncharacterized protein n=1 Tax=Arundo donax TaxID=35708 RepID=A0A0A9ADI9_ARUDO